MTGTPRSSEVQLRTGHLFLYIMLPFTPRYPFASWKCKRVQVQTSEKGKTGCPVSIRMHAVSKLLIDKLPRHRKLAKDAVSAVNRRMASPQIGVISGFMTLIAIVSVKFTTNLALYFGVMLTMLRRQQQCWLPSHTTRSR